MKYWHYTFEDGYFCWTVGKMNRVELANETRNHGKVISMTCQRV